MAVIKTNTELIGRDSNSLENYISIIQKAIAKLESDYAELDKMWDGPASEIFKLSGQNDIEAVKLLVNNLKKIKSFENKAQKKYLTCENEVSDTINALR